MFLRALVFALALAACGQEKAADNAPAPVSPAEATSTRPAAPDTSAYDAEILTWARSVYNVDGPNLIEPLTIFYGDFTGDGAPDALAFSYYDMGGSGAGLNVSLFRNTGGHMQHLRNVDEVLGQEPRDAHFSRGSVSVTTTVPGPGDPHCCPTKAHEWVIRAN